MKTPSRPNPLPNESPSNLVKKSSFKFKKMLIEEESDISDGLDEA
jgi:hypothetical protein